LRKVPIKKKGEHLGLTGSTGWDEKGGGKFAQTLGKGAFCSVGGETLFPEKSPVKGSEKGEFALEDTWRGKKDCGAGRINRRREEGQRILQEGQEKGDNLPRRSWKGVSAHGRGLAVRVRNGKRNGDWAYHGEGGKSLLVGFIPPKKRVAWYLEGKSPRMSAGSRCRRARRNVPMDNQRLWMFFEEDFQRETI